MSLRNSIRFQKALALAAAASNEFEAAAAELAARRLMETCNIDPTRIPNGSLYGRMSFADNPLLKKLRDEWCEAHPKSVNTKTKAKSKRTPATPVNMFEGMFDDLDGSVNTKPKAAEAATDGVNSPFADLSFEDFGKEPVNTKDRNRDRHSPGYMRDYMRRRRTKK